MVVDRVYGKDDLTLTQRRAFKRLLREWGGSDGSGAVPRAELDESTGEVWLTLSWGEGSGKWVRYLLPRRGNPIRTY